MTEAIQKAQPQEIAAWQDKLDLIKQTVAKGATNTELDLFLYTCRRTGLDPLAKQIYAIKRKSKQGEQWVDTMTIQTGIDGYRLIA
ncbi:MAG TPA: recombinase RecT, partial [Candidatus Paceibacterota bacterium]